MSIDPYAGRVMNPLYIYKTYTNNVQYVQEDVNKDSSTAHLPALDQRQRAVTTANNGSNNRQHVNPKPPPIVARGRR